MAEQKHEAQEGRAGELGREEASDGRQAETREAAAPQQGEGRMSGARTGRFGGAHEDAADIPSGFTPEGRSGT